MNEEQGMLKQFGPDQWNGLPGDGDQQIKVASSGLGFSDRKTAEKFASPELLHWLGRMDTSPDCVYVHKIAMGCSDIYGPNRWGDGFRADVLERDCPTFEQYAKAYRNHKSKSDDPYFGRPKIARFRKPMGVVELVTEYYGNEKVASANGGLVADKELEELAKHGSIAVSMGSKVPGDRCLPDWAMINVLDGEKPVPEIQVGDMVLTHCGDYRRVTALIRTPAEGKRLIAISAAGYLKTLDVTDNHPIWVIRQEAVRDKTGHLRAKPDFTPTFIDAGETKVGDYLVRHVRTLTGRAPISNELAYLLGQYLGDGCLEDTGKSNCVSLTTAVTDSEIIERIEECCHLLGLPYHVDPPSKGAVRIRIKNPRRGLSEFVNLCRQFCGKTVDKYLRDLAFDWTEENALHFLGGYIDADGSWDPLRKNIRYGSVLPRLTDSIQELCLAVGIRSTGSEADYSENAWAVSDSFYQYTIGQQDTNRLFEFACRVLELGSFKKPALNIFFEQDGTRYLATRVMHVRDIDYQGEFVYNFSVDEHETYTSFGYVVHNCVICGNWAPKRAMYCEAKSRGGTCELFGCKRGMLKIAADGRQQHVDNPINLFYDISHVGRGADPIAHGLVLPMGKLAAAATLDDYLKVAEYFPSNLVPVEAQLTENARKMLKLAQIFADLEAKYASYAPDTDVDLGMVYGVDYSGHTNVIHSSLHKVAKIAIRELARADICPDFESFAKAAGYSDSKIASMRPIVADMYTQLNRQRAITSVVNLADFSEIHLPNLVTSKTACIHDGCTQASVLARALSGNAEGAQLKTVPRLQESQTIPDIVAKYAAFKLAWAVHNPKIDPWRMNVLVKRELVTLANEPTK